MPKKQFRSWVTCRKCGGETKVVLTTGLGNSTAKFECKDCHRGMTYYYPQSTNHNSSIKLKKTLNLSWLTFPYVTPFIDRYVSCPECNSSDAEISGKRYDDHSTALACYCPDCHARDYSRLVPQQ